MTPQMQSDPTLDFMAKLNNPNEWVVIRNAPIFKPHERMTKTPDGKDAKISITSEDLPNIAYQINQRETEDGVPAVLTIGHRKQGDPNFPEELQPDIVGYARNAKVGFFGVSRTPAVLADLYYKAEDYEKAKKFPFRSVDFYPNSNKVTGVAVLKRDPFLGLGIVEYQEEEKDSEEDTKPKAYRAPRGGISLEGQKFFSGQHIPSVYADKMTAEQKDLCVVYAGFEGNPTGETETRKAPRQGITTPSGKKMAGGQTALPYAGQLPNNKFNKVLKQTEPVKYAGPKVNPVAAKMSQAAPKQAKAPAAPPTPPPPPVGTVQQILNSAPHDVQSQLGTHLGNTLANKTGQYITDAQLQDLHALKQGFTPQPAPPGAMKQGLQAAGNFLNQNSHVKNALIGAGAGGLLGAAKQGITGEGDLAEEATKGALIGGAAGGLGSLAARGMRPGQATGQASGTPPPAPAPQAEMPTAIPVQSAIPVYPTVKPAPQGAPTGPFTEGKPGVKGDPGTIGEAVHPAKQQIRVGLKDKINQTLKTNPWGAVPMIQQAIMSGHFSEGEKARLASLLTKIQERHTAQPGQVPWAQPVPQPPPPVSPRQGKGFLPQEGYPGSQTNPHAPPPPSEADAWRGLSPQQRAEEAAQGIRYPEGLYRPGQHPGQGNTGGALVADPAEPTGFSLDKKPVVYRAPVTGCFAGGRWFGPGQHIPPSFVTTYDDNDPPIPKANISVRPHLGGGIGGLLGTAAGGIGGGLLAPAVGLDPMVGVGLGALAGAPVGGALGGLAGEAAREPDPMWMPNNPKAGYTPERKHHYLGAALGGGLGGLAGLGTAAGLGAAGFHPPGEAIAGLGAGQGATAGTLISARGDYDKAQKAEKKPYAAEAPDSEPNKPVVRRAGAGGELHGGYFFAPGQHIPSRFVATETGLEVSPKVEPVKNYGLALTPENSTLATQTKARQLGSLAPGSRVEAKPKERWSEPGPVIGPVGTPGEGSSLVPIFAKPVPKTEIVPQNADIAPPAVSPTASTMKKPVGYAGFGAAMKGIGSSLKGRGVEAVKQGLVGAGTMAGTNALVAKLSGGDPVQAAKEGALFGGVSGGINGAAFGKPHVPNAQPPEFGKPMMNQYAGTGELVGRIGGATVGGLGGSVVAPVAGTAAGGIAGEELGGHLGKKFDAMPTKQKIGAVMGAPLGIPGMWAGSKIAKQFQGEEISLSYEAHDVSDEKRDSSGKWTAGGDISGDDDEPARRFKKQGFGKLKSEIEKSGSVKEGSIRIPQTTGRMLSPKTKLQDVIDHIPDGYEWGDVLEDIEDEFHITIHPDDVDDLDTLGDFIKYIHAGGSKDFPDSNSDRKEKKRSFLHHFHPFCDDAVPVTYAATHAPKGGVTVQGQKFTGGEFIPGEVMAKATPEEKEKIKTAKEGEPTPAKKGGFFTKAKPAQEAIHPELKDNITHFIANAPKEVQQELSNHLNATLTGRVGDYISKATPEELHELSKALEDKMPVGEDRAPSKGIKLEGHFYSAGMHVPKGVVDRATPEEQALIRGPSFGDTFSRVARVGTQVALPVPWFIKAPAMAAMKAFHLVGGNSNEPTSSSAKTRKTLGTLAVIGTVAAILMHRKAIGKSVWGGVPSFGQVHGAVKGAVQGGAPEFGKPMGQIKAPETPALASPKPEGLAKPMGQFNTIQDPATKRVRRMTPDEISHFKSKFGAE